MKALNLYFFIFLFICPQILFAYQKVDSLKLLLEETLSDHNKLGALLELIDLTSLSDPYNLEYLDQAQKLAEKLEDYKTQARILNIKGSCHQVRQEFTQALYFARQALKVAQEHQITGIFPSVLSNMGHTYWRLSQLDSAISVYQEALKYFEQMGHKYTSWKTFVGLARCYTDLKDNEQVENNLLSAYEIVKDSENRADKGSVLYFLAIHYNDTEEFDKYYDVLSDWEAFQKEKEQDVLEMGEVGHASILSMFNQPTEETIEKLQNAVAFYQNRGNPFRLGWSYADLGQAFYSQGELIPARDYYSKALEQFQIVNYKERLSETYNQLYQIEKELNNFPAALNYLEEHEALKDSLGFEKMKAHIADLEIAYETEKKEQLLALQDLELAQKTTQRNIFIGSSFLLATLALLIFFGLRSRIRLTKKIAQQSADIQDQKIKQLEQEKHLMAYNSMLEGQEKERIRIAKDLHDSLGGLLTTVKAHFNALKPKDLKPKSNEIYSKTNKLIDDASVEIRRISHNMVPKALTISGLKGAMEDLVENLEAHGIQSNLEMVNIEEEIPQSKALVIYRTIQEISNNIIKHAEAKNVLVQLIKNQGQLSIFIEDDGKGFVVNEALEKGGMGLQNIESRVQFLRGKIDWDSIPGEGTTVSITVPLVQQKQSTVAA